MGAGEDGDEPATDPDGLGLSREPVQPTMVERIVTPARNIAERRRKGLRGSGIIATSTQSRRANVVHPYARDASAPAIGPLTGIKHRLHRVFAQHFPSSLHDKGGAVIRKPI